MARAAGAVGKAALAADVAGRCRSNCRRTEAADPFSRPAKHGRMERRVAAIAGWTDMIERKERKPYWRHTKWQMVATLVPLLLAMVLLPLYADLLNSNRFLGFPLGYFLAGPALMLIALTAIGSFVNRQDAIDHWHGAHEDV
jgi:putative solute:sodium symporter small subunit